MEGNPILFSAGHPLILRPLSPMGFAIETPDGQTIFTCATNYDDVKFTIRSGPTPDTAVFTFDATWWENQ